MPSLRPTKASAVVVTLSLAWVGCADVCSVATCDGALNTVVKGRVRGHDVDVETLDVVGTLARERFQLSFPAPDSAPPEHRGRWLLDFGFNPLGGTQSTATRIDNMVDWYSQQGGPLPFWLTSRDSGVPCDPQRGSLCGGFGVDPDGTGFLERDQSNDVERYHRFVEGEEFVGAGTLRFDKLTPEEWKASFEVEVDWDERDDIMPGGSLEGCFRAVLVGIARSSRCAQASLTELASSANDPSGG